MAKWTEESLVELQTFLTHDPLLHSMWLSMPATDTRIGWLTGIIRDLIEEIQHNESEPPDTKPKPVKAKWHHP